MKLYLDSSALVKRYVEEPGSPAVAEAMDEADAWTTSQITFVETLRVVGSDAGAMRRARDDWDEFDVIGLTPAVCERALALAGEHELKTLDAIQLGSAAMSTLSDLTFATFDRRLHAAARAEGFETLPASLS